MADSAITQVQQGISQKLRMAKEKKDAEDAQAAEDADTEAGLKSGKYQPTGQTLTDAQKNEPPAEIREPPKTRRARMYTNPRSQVSDQ